MSSFLSATALKMSDIPRIQTFHPSLEEMQDFNAYIKYIESTGAHEAGICKVVPPPEWKPNDGNYDAMDITIPRPLVQRMQGSHGVYRQTCEGMKPIHISDFKKKATSIKYRTPTVEAKEELEAYYWENITDTTAVYGADVPASLFDPEQTSFNVAKLGSILDLLTKEEIHILGVTSTYLYFGMWKTTFPWHTEDMDLLSINLVHHGYAKIWYAIPPIHGWRLEKLAKTYFPDEFRDCPAFMRHKMVMISPEVLRRNSIQVDMIWQHEGEFIITFPYGYHAGFNTGFNCAESLNFATERWIEYGKHCSVCPCPSVGVRFPMDCFIKEFQPEQWPEWSQGIRTGCHPEDPDLRGQSTSPDLFVAQACFATPSCSSVENDPTHPVRFARERTHHPQQQVPNPSESQAELTAAENEAAALRGELSPSFGATVPFTLTEDWALALKHVWQVRMPNLAAVRRYNRIMTLRTPHCTICALIVPFEYEQEASWFTNPLTKDAIVTWGKNRPIPEQTRPQLPETCFFSHSDSEQSILDLNLSEDLGQSPLLICHDCQVCVHASCYGATYRPRKRWKCHRCAETGTSEECALCFLRGGALTKTTDGMWVHMVCALLLPEMKFENDSRSLINITNIQEARSKLKCQFCEPMTGNIKRFSACIQCYNGRCMETFHVTCAYSAGTVFKVTNWPHPLVASCSRHQERPPDKLLYARMPSLVTVGEKVLARHKNGRYYNVKIKSITEMTYYWADFDEGSVSHDLLPQDIMGRNCIANGPPDVSEKVQILWKDGVRYGATFRGVHNFMEYKVEFDDGTFRVLKREDLWADIETLPNSVQNRVSTIAESKPVQKPDFTPTTEKRRRKPAGAYQELVGKTPKRPST